MRSVIADTQRLVTLIKPNGQFVYEIDLQSGTQSNRYSMARHCLCLWAIHIAERLHQLTSIEQEKLAQAWAVLIEHRIRRAKGGQCVISGARTGNLGSTAIAGLALLAKYNQHHGLDEADMKLLQDLAAYTVSVRRQAGSYIHYLDTEAGKPFPDEDLFFDFEANLFLLSFDEIIGDRRIRKLAEQDLPALFKHKHSFSSAHWLFKSVLVARPSVVDPGAVDGFAKEYLAIIGQFRNAPPSSAALPPRAEALAAYAGFLMRSDRHDEFDAAIELARQSLQALNTLRTVDGLYRLDARTNRFQIDVLAHIIIAKLAYIEVFDNITAGHRTH
jgi:hypothetical protein